jgi:hypothetical protein
MNGNEENESAAYVEEQNDTNIRKLSSTQEQHKALLALLQGSNTLQSHNVNQLTTGNPGIICIFTNSHDSYTFILDTGAIDHVCFSDKSFSA